MTTQKIPVPTVRHGGDTFSYKLITYRQKNHKSIAFIKRNRQQTAVGAKAPLPDLALFPPKLGATGESERREPCLRTLLRTLVPAHPNDIESGSIQICLRILRPCAISRVSQFEDPSPRPSPRQGSGRGRNPNVASHACAACCAPWFQVIRVTSNRVTSRSACACCVLAQFHEFRNSKTPHPDPLPAKARGEGGILICLPVSQMFRRLERRRLSIVCP